nr:hypothetical protein JVH1_0370 [Rhodococcus sp. JVH1]
MRAAARDHERHDADKDHDGDDFHPLRLPTPRASYAAPRLPPPVRWREVQWDNRKRRQPAVGGGPRAETFAAVVDTMG